MLAPAVSVVMTVWNANREFLQQAIRSILEQTFRDFELIVVEDPSPQPVADLIAAFRDERIRLVRRNERAPIGIALNEGIATARAPLIARMDADDIALPERLERQLAFLRAHQEIAVYGSRITIIDETNRVIGHRILPLTHDEIAASMRRYNCISHPSVMFRRDAFERAGGYSDAPRVEDYDLWCRMLVEGSRFESCADELLQYRVHSEASKFRGVHDEIRATMAIKRRYFSDAFTLHDRARLLAEAALLRIPPSLIVRLFLWLEYRKA
jgi:glycosyltransferase involved in cell wall biosynthesis